MDYGLFEAAPAAVAWLREQAPAPARLRVVGDDDTDGATGAHVLATSLRRAGYDVEAVLQPIHTDADIDLALAGSFDAWLVADAGSAFLPAIERRKKPVLIVDHHTVSDAKPRHVHELNPRRIGGRRTWGVSASVVAYVFAEALDAKKNVDLAPAAIAGGVSDRQHLGGFHGLLGYCVEVAVARKKLAKTQGLTLDGKTVLDAVAGSIDPYFARFTGDADATKALLKSLEVPPQAAPEALTGGQAKRIATRLDEELARQGALQERAFPLFGDRLRLPGGNVPTVFALTHLLEAVTAAGAHQLAFALLAGQPEAVDEAMIVHRQRQRGLVDEARRLRQHVQDAGPYRWTETTDAPNTGVYAHILLSSVHGDDKPLLVLASVPHGVKASARGSPRLYLAGIDLSVAVPRAAATAGGSGGGHPGAAGATVPTAGRARFLAALGAELERLRKAGGAA